VGNSLCFTTRFSKLPSRKSIVSTTLNGLSEVTDRYLIRDAQRVIEAIESLVRMHNAQEKHIYERAATA
jgi:hypothetical protein